MHNYYDHEAILPTDKASNKALYNDFFHDSIITGISLNAKQRQLELHLQCSRDCEAETGSREAIYHEKYGYKMIFSVVTHSEIHTKLHCPEYLNGRFKAIPKGNYYFRIQTDDGYIDIAYRHFKLRKATGRVSYSGIEGFQPELDRKYDSPAEVTNHILRRIASGQYTASDDFALFLDLQRLYASRVENLAPYLRQCLAAPWASEDAKPFAAWLLGKFGAAEDIPLLYPLLSQFQQPIIKRNLMDAMDALLSQ